MKWPNTKKFRTMCFVSYAVVVLLCLKTTGTEKYNLMPLSGHPGLRKIPSKTESYSALLQGSMA